MSNNIVKELSEEISKQIDAYVKTKISSLKKETKKLEAIIDEKMEELSTSGDKIKKLVKENNELKEKVDQLEKVTKQMHPTINDASVFFNSRIFKKKFANKI